jgi:hypothetical protein
VTYVRFRVPTGVTQQAIADLKRFAEERGMGVVSDVMVYDEVDFFADASPKGGAASASADPKTAVPPSDDPGEGRESQLG